MSEAVKNRTIKIVFYSVTVLLTAQVAWWAWTFVSHVDELSRVKLLHAEPQQIETIQKEAFHKRVMFLSESGFFLLVVGFGIIVLYRALRIEEKARLAQRNFVEIMSHESKTPITALKLRLESVLDKRSSDETLVKDLKSSLLEVRRLSSLFDKAMSLSRAEREAFKPEMIPVADLVRSVLGRMEPVLLERGVQIKSDIDITLCVHGDVMSLQSSIQSILENAVYYNDKPQKMVRIQAAGDSARVSIFIDDNGPGISPTDRPLVFERFYRGERYQSVPGSGLGLFLAKKIALAHDGNLSVAESDLGGARFCLELPRETV